LLHLIKDHRGREVHLARLDNPRLEPHCRTSQRPSRLTTREDGG
jgi:hypothetical protein